MHDLTAETPRDTVPAVVKASQVLEALAAAREPVTLADLTKRLGLAKSSVLGLCNTLARTGLATRHADGRYSLGMRLVDLAHAYLAGVDITREFGAVLDETGAFAREGVVLAVLDGRDVVYVACRQGAVPLAVSYRIGMRLPASCTATGKALLATLSDQRLRELYEGQTLSQPTPHSHGEIEALFEDVRRVRERGYAIDDQETREGMMCTGAAVFDATGSSGAAAVAVSMLRWPDEPAKCQAVAAEVRNFAQALSRRLGATL